MNRIIFPLKLQMKSPEVRDLQRVLSGLGHEIAESEEAEQRFGAATRKAVVAFQKEHGLEPSGVVDQDTAELLTSEWERQASPEGGDEVFVVKGVVRQHDGQPLAGGLVRAFDQDLRGEDFLGEASTDQEGNYQITFTAERFRRSPNEVGGPDLVVRVYASDGRLIAKTKRKNNAAQQEVVNLVVEAGSFVVRGSVLNSDGSPIPRAIVKAFDIGLRMETPLGEAPTRADGEYEIRYRREHLRPESKLAADLIVRVYDGAGNELARSGLLCRAPAEAVVDLVVGNQPLRGASEYGTLVATVRPYLGETVLADLEREDVQFLACSAAVDPHQVATLIVGNRLTRETSLPDWLFYALGRQGVRLQLEAILGHSLKNLRESIERAIEMNVVVPLADAAELDRWVNRLKSVLLKTVFEASADPGRLSVGELIGTSLVSREVQESFLSRYLDREGSLEEFWRGLEEDESFNADAREDLRFTLHLGMLTQYHAPLLLQLKDLRQRGEFKSLRDLAGFDRKRWRQLLEAGATNGEIILPPDTPGQTPEERLNHYITTLREPIEALFPSDGLRHALTRVPDSSPPIRTFLSNTPMLDLYWSNVDDFVSEHADTAFDGIADDQRAGVAEEIKVLQRLLRVAPSADQVTILRQAGFTSSYVMARTARRHFRKRFVEAAAELKDSLDGAYMVLSPATEDVPAGNTQMMLLSGKSPETMADILHNQASYKAAAGVQLVLNAHALGERLPFAIGGSKEAQEQAKKKFLKKNPNLETLFGSLSYCECQHCRSVYSPAAYFVDLLHWLEAPGENLTGELKNAKGPIHVLLKRRPDLANLALTCENTNTTLPYIDVVNEVLESYIFTRLDANNDWSDAAVAGKTLKARDTGKAKAEELRVVPQYIIPEVYDHLAQKAVYPMTLPFHRPLEVTRAYLAHLGTSRAEIMAVFQAGTSVSPSEAEISKERLGLSPALANIITASGDPGTIGNMHVWQYYGLTNQDELQSKLAKVPEFVSRTGLTVEELTDLLKTRFINPHIFEVDPNTLKPDPKITIQIIIDTEEPCDVSRMTLNDLEWTDTGVIELQWLRRIHRFLRLWRVLAWSMTDVDRAIHAFGGELDGATLSQIEALQWLKEELREPIENLLAFWGNIDTWGSKSLYDRLFFDKALVPTDPKEPKVASVFTLTTDQIELADTKQPLENNLSTIFAALQLAIVDYEMITKVEQLSIDQQTKKPILNLYNLSLLHRYGALARALKLRVKDIANLVRLVPDDHYPFHPNDPEATRLFVRLVRRIQESNFSVPLLNYLFRHEEEPTRHPAPTRILIFNTLKTIADGLAQVNQETQPGEDPLGEELRNQLSLLQPLLTAPKPVEENKYIKPEEIAQTVDIVDWRRDDFLQSAGQTFLQKLHDTLVKDLDSSFLGPDLSKDKSALFGNLQPNETKDERFANNVVYLRDKLLPWLRVRLQRSLISQILAAALGIDESVTKTLLERVLESTAKPPTPGQPQPALTDFLDLAALNDFLKLVKDQGGPQAFDVLNYKAPPVLTFIRVFKAAQVAKAFEMTEAELTYLSDNSPSFENFNLNKLPLELTQSETLPKQLFLGWIALERFFDLRNSLPKSEKNLVQVLKDKSLATMVEATGWDKQWVDSLLKSLPDGLGIGLANLTVADLVRLRSAIALIKRTGAPAKTLVLSAQKEPDHEQAEEVIEAAKSRYDRERWLEVARSINDPLRAKQRAALVDFLVPRMKKDTFESPNELLEHFLIDVEMSSCMLTSRIKQAISSVQMFVQRCLLSLESEVSPDDIYADQWKWMKNYRVWEANRKVFLYPENWIEPELRDDKSPFFKDLETELLQNELTDETVEKALINYLYKLDEVARLDIRGFWKEDIKDDSEEKEIYHVFGRTWNPPYVYYYRKGIFPKNGPLADEWTPWERIELDIGSNHLIPIIHDRRMYVFWPIVEEKPDPTFPDTPRYQVRLAWSEYRGGHWSGKTIASVPAAEIKATWEGKPGSYTQSYIPVLPFIYAGVVIDEPFGKPVPYEAHFWFNPRILDNRLQIDVVYEDRAGDQIHYLGTFELACGKELSLIIKTDSELNTIPLELEKHLLSGHIWYQRIESSESALELPLFSPGKLINSPHGWYLAPSKQDFSPPFFFQDGPKGSQTYFARPVLEKVTSPENVIGTWSDSTKTIKEPAKIDTSSAWTKPSPDPVAKLASGVTLGIYPENG
jgi:peptidoglycan hydrolase-like protein with peptidoglycan-binding domain